MTFDFFSQVSDPGSFWPSCLFFSGFVDCISWVLTSSTALVLEVVDGVASFITSNENLHLVAFSPCQLRLLRLFFIFIVTNSYYTNTTTLQRKIQVGSTCQH